MSFLQELSPAEIIAVEDAVRVNSYCVLAADVLLIYEAMVTFNSEVEYFWKAKLTGASVLYFINKYSAIAYHVMSLAQNLPHLTLKSCDGIQKTLTGLLILNDIPWPAFSTLRVFALTKSWSLSALVLILSLAPAAVNMGYYIAHQGVGYMDPVYGCTEINDGTLREVLIVTIVSRVCLTMADALVIVITLYNTSWRSQLTRLTSARSLASIMLRDGVGCFAILLVLNVLHLMFNLFSIFGVQSQGIITFFTTPLITILIGRFLLHLQESAARMLRVPTDNSQGLDLAIDTRPSFVRSRIMGSIAHRANDGENELEDEDNAAEYETQSSNGGDQAPLRH